jgi:hypothetical protein
MIRGRIGPGVPFPMTGRNACPTNPLDLTRDRGAHTAERFKFPPPARRFGPGRLKLTFKCRGRNFRIMTRRETSSTD